MRLASFPSVASAIAFASLLALPACSSSSTGGGGGSAPIPQDQFVAQVGAAICDQIGPCCTSAGYTYDAAKCKEALTSSLQSQLADPLRKYDSAAGGNCVAAAKAAAPKCFADASTLSFITACDNVVVGTVAAGGSCTSSGQCAVPAGASGASCSNGKCVLQTRGKAGDACSATCTKASNGNTDCWSSSGAPTGNATYCWIEDGVACGADFKCQAVAALGQPCTYGGCVATAYCGSDQKCAARAGVGGACSGSDTCVDGTYCGSDSKCAAQKANGSTCTSSSECTSGHCDSATKKCAAETILSPEMCGAPVATPATGG